MNTVDFITYSGEINSQGYELICDALKQKKSENVVLVLSTPGGDPHAGFRIARALQHAYDKFHALIPRFCKSAGTLILTGAHKIIMDDMSELGPLDIQIKKGDELIGRNSGLDIFQAVTYLQNQSMNAFVGYLLELTRNAGLSTRVASDIATRLTSGLFEPIAGQIDPIKLAEMQRATEIAFEYGNRLNEKGRNMRSNGIQKLVTGYPSHSFVIDRKEARLIFINVDKPNTMLAQLSGILHLSMIEKTNSQIPDIKFYTFDIPIDENPTGAAHDANTPNPEIIAAGAKGSESPISPGSQNAEPTEIRTAEQTTEQPTESTGNSPQSD